MILYRTVIIAQKGSFSSKRGVRRKVLYLTQKWQLKVYIVCLQAYVICSCFNFYTWVTKFIWSWLMLTGNLLLQLQLNKKCVVEFQRGPLLLDPCERRKKCIFTENSKRCIALNKRYVKYLGLWAHWKKARVTMFELSKNGFNWLNYLPTLQKN